MNGERPQGRGWPEPRARSPLPAPSPWQLVTTGPCRRRRRPALPPVPARRLLRGRDEVLRCRDHPGPGAHAQPLRGVPRPQGDRPHGHPRHRGHPQTLQELSDPVGTPRTHGHPRLTLQEHTPPQNSMGTLGTLWGSHLRGHSQTPLALPSPTDTPKPHRAPQPEPCGHPQPRHPPRARGQRSGSGLARCLGSRQTSSWTSSGTSASQTWAWPATSPRRSPTPACECAHAPARPAHPPGTAPDPALCPPQGHPRVHGSRGAAERSGVRQQRRLVLAGLHALQAAPGVSYVGTGGCGRARVGAGGRPPSSPLPSRPQAQPLPAAQDEGQARDRPDDPHHGELGHPCAPSVSWQRPGGAPGAWGGLCLHGTGRARARCARV